MKNWVLMAAVVLFFAGCAKYTTPRKVSRQITDKTWRITTFNINGVSVLTGYTKFGFDFYPDDKDVVADQHKIVVSGASEGVTGRWQTGEDRNPAILYMELPPVDGLEHLADDWLVLEMTNHKMKLQRNEANETGSLLVMEK